MSNRKLGWCLLAATCLPTGIVASMYASDQGEHELHSNVDLNGDGIPDTIEFVRKRHSVISRVNVILSRGDGNMYFAKAEIRDLRTWCFPTTRDITDLDGNGAIDIRVSPKDPWQNEKKYIYALNDGNANFTINYVVDGKK
tara:strand:- start:1573 stop:1995 length:423 start_codon:yes stop_codon:yes gene_type:complete